MPQSIFEKAKKCLKPNELVGIVLESFSRQEIARAIASAGVVYPGVRIESLSHEELAGGWVEDALGDPGIFSGLEKVMDKVHHADIEQIRLLSLADIERMIQSVPRICLRRKIGGLFWAFLRDDRPESLVLLRRFLEAFYRFLDKQDKKLEKMESFQEHLQQGRLNKKEIEKLKNILCNLMAENKEIKKTLEKERRDKNKLERQLDDSRRNTAVRESEMRLLKNDLSALRKELPRKDGLIRDLEEKLKAASTEEKQSLRRRVHDLEREDRKLRHEAAELNERLTAARDILRTKDGLLLERQREPDRLRLEKERLENELKRLSSPEAVGSQPSAAGKPSAAPLKERGRRLGVFVDVRSLWQASRLMERKVDFEKLLDFIVLDRHLVKAVAYILGPAENDYSRFIGILEQKGFQARLRHFIRLPDGSIQGGWGAGMAGEIVALSEKMKLDIVHLVVSDGDFGDVMKFLKSKGIRTECSGFAVNAARELTQTADEFLALGEDILKSG